MFENYVKTAWRTLRKNKVFSALNITGLSIGVCSFLLIALYVLDELNYDKYNAHADRIYRINEQIKFGDFQYYGAKASAIIGPAMANKFPQISHYTRFLNRGSVVIEKGRENVNEAKVIYTDSSVFDVFSLPMIAGDPKSALTAPNSVVITASAANKYFHSTDAVGKNLLINNTSCNITGVIKDIPEQSHFNFDFFIALAGLPDGTNDNWLNTNLVTYILLNPGTDARLMSTKINTALKEFSAPQFQGALNMSQAEFERAGNYMRCELMPLTDIHLHSNIAEELGTNGNIQMVYIFSAIALFILLLACVNFMNLSTARSSNRAKEVGVRKVLGSLRSNLITQFLSESFLVSLISFLFAIIMVFLLLPFFNQLAGKHIDINVLTVPVLLGVFLLMVAVSLIAGSYPAFFLSSFQPIDVLKGKLSRGFRGSLLRNTLVVFQFSISIILIIGTLVIYRQLTFINNKNIGFNRDQVMVINNTHVLNTQAAVFKNELLNLPGVKNATVTGFLPLKGSRSNRAISTNPLFDNKNFVTMQDWNIDENYIPTLQMQLIAGRNFSAEYATDSGAAIINEAASGILGNGNPLNKKIYRLEGLQNNKQTPLTVIGVISNFNFNSLHERITPLIFTRQPDNGSIAVRMDKNKIAQLLPAIRSKWKAMAPADPFSYYFLDEEFNQQYQADKRTGNLSMIFSVLAIVIACLGLFGLVSYAAEQRIKEIGIRKVMGAAMPDIVGMLSKEFTGLILLAICIASPIAWWIMNYWLRDFAYRITISWWIFAVAALLIIMIAFITTISQTIKAAVVNPAKSLRTE